MHVPGKWAQVLSVYTAWNSRSEVLTGRRGGMGKQVWECPDYDEAIFRIMIEGILGDSATQKQEEK